MAGIIISSWFIPSNQSTGWAFRSIDHYVLWTSIIKRRRSCVCKRKKNSSIGIHIYVQVSKVTFLVWNKIPEISSDCFPLVSSLVFIYMFINRAFFPILRIKRRDDIFAADDQKFFCRDSHNPFHSQIHNLLPHEEVSSTPFSGMIKVRHFMTV